MRLRSALNTELLGHELDLIAIRNHWHYGRPNLDCICGTSSLLYTITQPAGEAGGLRAFGFSGVRASGHAPRVRVVPARVEVAHVISAGVL